MRCSLHADALAEYRRAALYYGERSQGLGEAFVAEVEKAMHTVKTSPRTRAANERGVRRYLLRRFPFVVHYGIEQEVAPGNDERVVIYAIRHSRREPDEWLHRLPPPGADT